MDVIHLARLVPEQAKKFGEKTAMRFRDYTDEKWKEISWVEFDRYVEWVASSLMVDGVNVGDRIGLFSQNKPECLIVDYSIYSIGAVGIPMYATSTTSQIEYIIKDAGIELVFVGEQYQYDRAYEAIKSDCGLKQIVVFDTEVRLAVTDDNSVYFSDFMQKGYIYDNKSKIKTIRSKAKDEDLANILYTSGTSGEAKGVLLTYGMYMEALRVNDLKLKFLSEDESSLCFLPMTHIFEKAWDAFCLNRGIRLDINLKPLDIQMVLVEVKPTCMCCVPRFWEKIHHGIYEKINSMPFFAKALFKRGIKVGKRYNIEYKRLGHKPPLRLRLQYFIYRKTLFHILKKKIGLERGVLFPVAGAKLSDELCTFFRSIGIPIVVGYGLTESTATVSCFYEIDYHIGTVGSMIDGIEVKIGDNNEILLKGKTITSGYYNKPEITKESFTSDGFFRTGDAGIIDEHGHLIITERIKDLFKTSNGKYIAPQQIESILCSDNFIDMAAIIGDGNKYVTALIVPALPLIPELASNLGIKSGNIEEMLKDRRMYIFYENRIRKLQKNMAGFEQIKKFSLLPSAFSMEKGELTNTLKMRRKIIIQHYEKTIASMY